MYVELTKMDIIFRQSHGENLITEHMFKLGCGEPLVPGNSVPCFPAIDFGKVKGASDICWFMALYFLSAG